MKENTKAYGVFTSLVYCLIFYLGIPMLLCLFQYLLLRETKVSFFFPLAALYQIAAIMSDHWVLGGCCSRESYRMDCLRVSVRGMDLLKSFLLFDCLFRFLSTGWTLFGMAALEWFYLKNFSFIQVTGSFLVYTILVVYGVSMLGIVISRYFTLIVWNYLFSLLGMLLVFLLFFFFFRKNGHLACITIMALASFGISVWSVKNVIRKVACGYYDE